jgi:hypothetical protein
VNEDDIENLISEAMDTVTDLGDDTNRLSQQQSAEFYEGVAEECLARAGTIRSEMR